jgi:hypothetical protein
MVRAEAPSELCQEPGTLTEPLDPQCEATMGTGQLYALGLRTAKG